MKIKIHGATYPQIAAYERMTNLKIDVCEIFPFSEEIVLLCSNSVREAECDAFLSWCDSKGYAVECQKDTP